MDHTLRHHDEFAEEELAASEPVIRPFELVAIGCGVATLVGTFAVSSVLLKGALIGGSLIALMGSLLYFGFAPAAGSDDD